MARQKSTMERRRVVLFPCPFQGHVNPMLQLAALFKSRGFAVTILHTELHWPDPSTWPDFDFVSIPDGISDPSAYSMVSLVEALSSNCEAPFRAQMTRMLSGSSRRRGARKEEEEGGGGGVGDESFVGLIVDALFHKILAAARELGLPAVVLRTGSAANFNVALSFPMLIEKGYLPIKDSQLEELVTELPPLRVKDLTRIPDSNIAEMSRFIEQMIEVCKQSAGIIFNTFEAIEEAELEKIHRELHAPVFAVGPLHKLSPAAHASTMPPDYQCLQWLDKQAPASVLYVSFGSMASIGREQLLEIAWGLADCGRPFLWVVRPGLVKGQIDQLPREFEEEIAGIGLIVKWAPQLEVLGHPAIGAFWTHNGWNSTLESLCEGIPMLCTPCFSDQMGNARYVSHVWKVGITLEIALLERGDIKEKIKRLMAEEEGEAIRIRAKDFKEKTAECIEEAGSSYMAFDRLLDHMLSLGDQIQQM